MSINTGGGEPTMSLRIIKFELHQEEMGQELAKIVNEALADVTANGTDAVPVLLGTYSAK